MDYARITPQPWTLKEHVFNDGSIAYRIYGGETLVAAFVRYEDAAFVMDMIEFKEEKASMEKLVADLEKERDQAIDQRDNLQGDVYLLKEELGQAKVP